MITAIDKKAALVLIDLQKGIAKAGTAHDIQTVLANAAKLVSGFRAASLPVIIVNVNPTGAPWLKSRIESPGMPADFKAPAEFVEIVDEIVTTPDDIFITKKTWTAFFETPLHEELQKRGITQIVLAGVSTSVGVEGTGRDASERAYNIAFATDAMTDRKIEAHEHSITNIFPRIGEVGTTEEIISFLSK